MLALRKERQGEARQQGVIPRFRALLREGLAPEQLALTICLGFAVGTLPIPWGTTLICVALAARFGLNQAATQAINYLLYPLQIALFFPFYRLGARCLPWGPAVSVDLVKEAFRGEFHGAFAGIFWAVAKATCAWLVTAVPLALLLYPVLVAAFKREGGAPEPPASE